MSKAEDIQNGGGAITTTEESVMILWRNGEHIGYIAKDPITHKNLFRASEDMDFDMIRSLFKREDKILTK